MHIKSQTTANTLHLGGESNPQPAVPKVETLSTKYTTPPGHAVQTLTRAGMCETEKKLQLKLGRGKVILCKHSCIKACMHVRKADRMKGGRRSE
jgi:hypothetical protein